MNKLIGAIVLVAGMAYGEGGDPPARIARLNYLQGSVSAQPAGVDNWTPATINYPMTTGDHLWVDSNSRAEMHIGSTAVHVDANTASSFLNLDDKTVQIRLSQGSLSVRIRYMADDDVYEIDTPNGAISLLRTGSYRINADPDSQTTSIAVRGGEAEVTAGGSAAPVHPRQTFVLTGTEAPSQDSRMADAPDAFDNWSLQRERREDNRPAARYVSTELPGYEDLDDYGAWRNYPGYGWCWTPRVEVGWAPYHYGHWRWVEPWGWTWVDDAPWGFAPFHYGRWAYVASAWIWVPGAGVAVAGPGVVIGGPRVAVFRPVYAPALVAFVGGGGWSASIAIGGGAGVAWFPLGPREVYVPAYHVSPAYVNRVNVVNVTNVTNVTNINNVNVTNVRYVNRTVPGAVTAVPQSAFASAQPVQRTAFQAPPGAIANAPIAGSAPAVAPTRQSFGAPAAAGVARPPSSALNRTVMSKATPPPAPVPFAARQSALRANPGRPVDPGTLSNLQRSSPAPHPLVRSASAPVSSGFGRTMNSPAAVSNTVPNQPRPVPNPVQNSGFSTPRPAVSQERAPRVERDAVQRPPVERTPPPARVSSERPERRQQPKAAEKHPPRKEHEREKEQ